MKMNGKTVLITGSTDGVGRYVARRLAAEGAKVMDSRGAAILRLVRKRLRALSLELAGCHRESAQTWLGKY